MDYMLEDGCKCKYLNTFFQIEFSSLVLGGAGGVGLVWTEFIYDDGNAVGC